MQTLRVNTALGAGSTVVIPYTFPLNPVQPTSCDKKNHSREQTLTLFPSPYDIYIHTPRPLTD